MSLKITFIGAGSIGFTRGLVRDILSVPEFDDAEIALTFPVATVAKAWIARQDGSGWVAIVEILLFFAILIAALAYVWGKGELDWSRELTSSEEMP